MILVKDEIMQWYKCSRNELITMIKRKGNNINVWSIK